MITLDEPAFIMLEEINPSKDLKPMLLRCKIINSPT